MCSIALAKEGKLLECCEGDAAGRILGRGRGKNGFGYDPLFIPKDHEKTFAEMTSTYKNKISHRSAALKKMKKEIKKYL